MELLYSSTPTNPNNTLSLTQPFHTSFHNKSWNPKPTLRYRKPSKTPSFSIYFLSCNTTKFQAFAQFGRPTSRRRNSLRKKLIEDHKVNPSSELQLLNTNFDDSESKLSYANVKESEFSSWVANDKVKVGEFSNGGSHDSVVKGFGELKESNGFGESVLLGKLESWIEQYKRDTEYWGIGSGHIFTVYQGSDGNVERVLVNEDEILRRSRIERWGLEGSPEVNLKILQAESLAREMESGASVIPRNSSVAKFVVQGEESGFFKTIQCFTLQPDFWPKLSRVGRLMVYVLVALWALKKLFGAGNKEEKYTELEKEMMRRKMKARQDREVLEKGSLEVEVIQESSEVPLVCFEKPNLDRKELMSNIVSAKLVNGKLALQDYSNCMSIMSSEFDLKVQEIKDMARKAREIEQMEHFSGGNDKKETHPVIDEFSDKVKVEQQTEEGANTPNILDGDYRQAMGSDDAAVHGKLDSVEDEDIQSLKTACVAVSDDMQSTKHQIHKEENLDLENDAPLVDSNRAKNSFVQVKPRVIRSVKEAREYLSKKSDKNEELQVEPVQGSDALSRLQRDKNENQVGEMANNAYMYAILDGTSDSPPARNASRDFSPKVRQSDDTMIVIPEKNDAEVEGDKGEIIDDDQRPQSLLNDEGNGRISVTEPSAKQENWIEDNFGAFEPIVKKIGVGFRDNYMVSRKKEDQESGSNIAELGSDKDDNSELDWMKDDSLREIVLQVRENELGGRDPFYMMDAEDKDAFFKGLEKKVEKENQKLSKLHGWLHSNIENLDYGADGISIYDPPEKIIPRWKGPPIEKSPEFLNYFQEQRKAIFSDSPGISYPVKKDDKSIPQSLGTIPNSSSDNDPRNNNKFDSKTLIEASDGSIRAGKKSGKEFWQHTKKWSLGFVESYNAETDPEIKTTIKDVGKDLDRWITEKEIQEAAEFMDKMPEKSKVFMEKKLSKLRREMELFGPEAVVSKYREYAEVKEEDYLWWLDLPYVLCIELYTDDSEDNRIGFYSLEMAADLELEPKPYHIIGFEDTNDCKNFCYIIQAQMEMLGNGHAFVVPQPPKDVFRDAKANGFGVTVIRKRELQLHVDQTLEEVEEQITEIGSKIYHDKIMQERSMDVSSLMKGVFGFSGKPIRRKRPKKMMKDVTGFSGKPTKRKRSEQRLKKPKQKGG